MKIIKFNIFCLLFSLLFSLNVNAESNAYAKISYGISSHDITITNNDGSSATIDDEGEGFLFAFGSKIGSWWGAEFMYYDMGDQSITCSSGDNFTYDGAIFECDASGTITSNTTGFGSGFTLNLSAGDLIDIYGKTGVHFWDKGGSTTIVRGSNSGMDSKFFNDGTDLYYGVGADINVTDSFAVSLAYDALSLSDSTFGDITGKMSNFATLGLKVSF